MRCEVATRRVSDSLSGHRCERGFESTGEGGGVAERAGAEAFAEVAAGGGETGKIVRGGHGETHVVGGCGGDPLGQAGVREEARADTGDVRRAGEGDHGHAHPEGFAGGGGAVVGERIERDVDAVVEREVVGDREFPAVEGETVGCDAVGGERGVQVGGDGGIAEAAGFQEETRGGQGAQNLGPECEDGGREFGEVVKAAEREGAGRGGGQGVDGRGVVVGAVAGERRGQADELFGVQRFGLADGIAHGVGEAVVDRGESGGIGITDPRGLHRRGAAREDEEAVVGGVAGEIDQDVERVAADEIGGSVVIEVGEVAPVFGVGAETRGETVGRADVGVTENLEARAVVRGEDGFDEVGDGVVVEIGREVADAEAARAQGGRGERRRGGGEGRGVGRVPAAVLGEKFGGREVGQRVEREEEIAVRAGGGLQGEGGAEVDDGFGEMALGLGEAPEVVVSRGVGGPEAQGFGVGGARLGGAAEGGEDVAEEIVRFGACGLEGDGTLDGGEGFGAGVGVEHGHGEVEPEGGPLGSEAGGGAEGGECCGELAERFLQIARLVVGFGERGIEGDGAGEGREGIGGTAQAAEGERVLDVERGGVGPGRRGGENLFVERRSLGEAAGAMVRDGGGEKGGRGGHDGRDGTEAARLSQAAVRARSGLSWVGTVARTCDPSPGVD